MTEYYVISESELNLKNNEIFLSLKEVQELLEYKDVFIKFLTKSIHSIQSDLANCRLVGKEPEAYSAIRTVKMLQDNLNKLEGSLKEFLDKNDKQ